MKLKQNRRVDWFENLVNKPHFIRFVSCRMEMKLFYVAHVCACRRNYWRKYICLKQAIYKNQHKQFLSISSIYVIITIPFHNHIMIGTTNLTDTTERVTLNVFLFRSYLESFNSPHFLFFTKLAHTIIIFYFSQNSCNLSFIVFISSIFLIEVIIRLVYRRWIEKFHFFLTYCFSFLVFLFSFPL